MAAITDPLAGPRVLDGRRRLERTDSNRTAPYSKDSESKTREINDAFTKSLELAANELLRDEIPFPHYFRHVKVSVRGMVMRLDGQVPTYYLKSVLQSRLQRAFSELSIENRVAVINACGLSSIPCEMLDQSDRS